MSATNGKAYGANGYHEHAEKVNGYDTQTRKGGKVRRCFRRFWWLCLLAFIAIALIVVLCIIFVALPHMAQSNVNSSTITITNLTVINPTADSVQMIQHAVIASNSSFHPWLDPFNVTIGLLGASPYASMLLPGIISGTAVPVVVNQNVSITDLPAFQQYNAAIMNSKSITQAINGGTYLHEGTLPVEYVTYDKQVYLAGFNNLTGFTLKTFKTIEPAQPDGTNALGTVMIPNPTVLTIDMGNVTFENWVPLNPNQADPQSNMTLIGNSTIENFVFRPGNNTYNMKSTVNTLGVLGLIGEGGPYAATKILPLTVVGKSSVKNGVELSYYDAALKAANQTINLNVTAALSGGPQ